MDTPICDFAEKYSASDPLRLHMPGHKGKAFVGPEYLDITEIDGADNLYSPDGIIMRSEKNAGRIFGCHTFYSTEGSSLCIRAMLYLAVLYAKINMRKPLIAAMRNVHKTFLSAVALLDADVMWLNSEDNKSYLTCSMSPEKLDTIFASLEEKPTAFYVTSPDYLGSMQDIKGLSKVCRKHGVLLLVDNAHGAYLKFLSNSLHPVDLGADICCDSAHKTLPTLTGGAYLHISYNAPEILKKYVKSAMALFASTSPSYLILESLDRTNVYLDCYGERLADFISEVEKLKYNLTCLGFELYGSEPLKITVKTKSYGYTGQELYKLLYEHNIVCEFADPDFLVMMLTSEIDKVGLLRILSTFKTVPKLSANMSVPPEFCIPERKMTIRDAIFSASEIIPVDMSLGRVISAVSVSCPPAVPIAMCGEVIDINVLKCFKYYEIDTVSVVIE